jgi:KDO2-lipid IV(A) lauroyltransferase
MSTGGDHRGGLGDWLEYVALRAVMGGAGLLPRPLMGRAGDLAGDFVYHVLRTRRTVVEENLAATLGQTLDRSGVNRIARNVYRHLGRTLFEYGRFGDLSAGGLPEWLEVCGFENLAAAHRRGRGVVVVTGHFGNWELLGAIVAQHRLPIHFLAKEQRNPYVDRYMDRARSRHLGVGVLNPGMELRRIFRCLRRGELIGMLFDQDAGADGIFLDVLGRVASVQPGAAVFSYRTGAPIVPCGVFRLPDGRHRASFEPAFDPDPGAPYEDEIRRLTALCEASLERYIYLHPEQYYWVHRRWKTRPPGERLPV